VSQAGVHLDLTCISDAAHFLQFKERQAAFRYVFCRARQQFQAKYNVLGALAFDAYIYLLKAFAAFVSRSAFSSFQATCLGLFALQRADLPKLAPAQVPNAIFLFERFLRFCRMFFAEKPGRKGQKPHGFRHCAIDLSGEGHLTRRVNLRACAELYFGDVECSFRVPPQDWLNVLHNSDPKTISAKARIALDRWFPEPGLWKVWGRICQDLTPAMGPQLLKAPATSV